MKKIIALLLAAVMILGLAACGSSSGTSTAETTTAAAETTAKETTAKETTAKETTTAGTSSLNTDIKVGVVLVGDENEGYTYAHIEGIKAAVKALGLPEENVVWYYSIPESEVCYDKCVDCADQGCSIVFTNSYGHQTYCQQAAAEYPDVTFVAMTGDTALTSGLTNFKNAFTNIYEARYVSGVVAGMKVAELVKAGKLADSNYDADGNVKIGYVGAYPYAEVVSGYTAFFLGIKSVYEKVSMEVQYTNSWFDITAENEAAKAMISDGCVIIGQHADSTGAPAACEEAYKAGTTVFSVGYNVDMLATAPDAALTSATNNWSVYYTYAIGQIMKGEEVDTNWSKGFTDKAVAITALGPNVAEGTADKVATVEAAISGGTLHVFDTSTFTVGGQAVTSFLARDTNGDWVNDTDEAIFDGYLHESYFQAAPCFSLRIDGITELNAD
ncbi:MAG: BMP family ABC transporter substrate-binding protein [Oscillospiraceae bacterium]|nr:BMP family ABC transporter substrate-binding protein [Oscillospiraceae bacterium]